jgi:hypothetical protein
VYGAALHSVTQFESDMRRTRALLSAGMSLLWLLVGCGAQPVLIPKPLQQTPSPRPLVGATVPAARQFLPFVAASAAVQAGVLTPAPTLAPAAQGCPEGCSLPPPGCLIKAQISVSGEKAYQLPGWKHYAETVVDPRFGDRWFCSTAEAVANGWHASTDR